MPGSSPGKRWQAGSSARPALALAECRALRPADFLLRRCGRDPQPEGCRARRRRTRSRGAGREHPPAGARRLRARGSALCRRPVPAPCFRRRRARACHVPARHCRPRWKPGGAAPALPLSGPSPRRRSESTWCASNPAAAAHTLEWPKQKQLLQPAGLWGCRLNVPGRHLGGETGHGGHVSQPGRARAGVPARLMRIQGH